MKHASAIAICLAMIFVSGCVTRPVVTISKDCLWADRIDWSLAEADAIVECCPDVARQLVTHNETYQRECNE